MMLELKMREGVKSQNPTILMAFRKMLLSLLYTSD